MKIEIRKFGELLTSRPDGREAYLILQLNQLQSLSLNENIEIDFLGVRVISPGWADEVITPLAKKFKNVKLLNTENYSVQATLKTLQEYSDLKI